MHVTELDDINSSSGRNEIHINAETVCKTAVFIMSKYFYYIDFSLCLFFYLLLFVNNIDISEDIFQRGDNKEIHLLNSLLI